MHTFIDSATSQLDTEFERICASDTAYKLLRLSENASKLAPKAAQIASELGELMMGKFAEIKAQIDAAIAAELAQYEAE